MAQEFELGGRRGTQANLLAGAFVLSVSGLVLLGLGFERWALPALVAAVILAIAAAIVAHRDFRLGFKKEQFGPGQQTNQDFEQWRDDLISAEQGSLFAQMLLFPSSIYSRIRESATPLTRATQFRTVYTMRLPEIAGSNPVYLPFIVVAKGTLFDDLYVTSGDGSELATLSYADYIQLVAAMLRNLIGSDSKLALQEYRAAAEEDLMDLIASRAPKSNIDHQRFGEVFGRLRSLQWGNEVTKLLVLAIAKLLVVHFAVVVEFRGDSKNGMPTDEDGTSDSESRRTERAPKCELIATSERRILPHSAPRFKSRPMAWCFDRARRLLGVRPSQFDLPIEKAQLAKSYHLEFMGPSGTYLARQALSGRDPDSPSYARLRSRFGQRYAHLYIRDASTESRDQVLRIAFFERTPGSLGAATVSALASFVLITIAGVLASRTPGVTMLAPPGDLMAILLALPGVAAAWVGLDRSSVPFGGTMAARLSSIVSFSLSLAAAAFYLGAVESPQFLRDFKIFGTTGIWACLAGAAALNFGWISYSWVRRSLLYSAVLARQSSVASGADVDAGQVVDKSS